MNHLNGSTILFPLFALAAWTALVQILIPLSRLRAAHRGEIGINDFKVGESSAVPANVSIPNRNYMNLLEFPVLFYVVCLLVYVATSVSPLMVTLAWTYVALRVAHSAIHLTYNRVSHRGMVFAFSNVVLLIFWVQAGIQISSQN